MICVCVCLLQLLNITMGVARLGAEQKVSVDITFAVRDGRDYLPGSEVSDHLRKLSLVEFSFYVGFPALQIAERTTQMHFNTILLSLSYCVCTCHNKSKY